MNCSRWLDADGRASRRSTPVVERLVVMNAARLFIPVTWCGCFEPRRGSESTPSAQWYASANTPQLLVRTSRKSGKIARPDLLISCSLPEAKSNSSSPSVQSLRRAFFQKTKNSFLNLLIHFKKIHNILLISISFAYNNKITKFQRNFQHP